MHDQPALEADLRAAKLVGRHAVLERVHLVEDRVEGFLRALGGASGVDRDDAAVAAAAVAGVDGVAEPAPLAHFGEEPARGLAAEDRGRQTAEERRRVALVGGVEPDRDVGLVRLIHLVGDAAHRGARLLHIDRLAVPALEQAIHGAGDRVRVDGAGDGQDRADRADAPHPVLTQGADLGALEGIEVAVAAAVERRRQMAFAQAQADAVLGVVLKALERLDREAADGVEGFARQVRADDKIGEERERLVDAGSDRCAAGDEVQACGADAALDARAVEGVAEFLAVALARAALGEFGQQARPTVAGVALGVACVSGGGQPTDRGGPNPRHLLDEKRHAALEDTGMNRIGAGRGLGRHRAEMLAVWAAF